MELLELFAKHRIASRWILLIVDFLIVIGLRFMGIPTAILLLFYLSTMVLIYFYVDVYTPLIIQIKDIHYMSDDCDPFPLLKSSERLLSYNLSTISRRSVLINYCVALRNTGDYEKAYELLKSIDLHDLNEKDYMIRCILLNNLADICALLKKEDEEVYYRRTFFEVYDKMPEGANKKSLFNSHMLTLADRAFHDEEYEKCIDILKDYKPLNKENDISVSLFKAQIYLKLDEKENAVHLLNHVITNGNKLYSVVEAKKLLEEIE